MPFIPVSVAPTESTTTMFGSRSISWSLIDWLKIAALEPIENSDDRSTSSYISSSLSASGRAMASPVMPSTLTFSDSITFHVCSASNLGVSTTVSPAMTLRITVTSPAPCIIGARVKLMPPPPPSATFWLSTEGSASFSFE